MEKELLERALNSILHGSTQVISRDDGYGNIKEETIHIGDLRVQLVNKLAEKLVNTDGFRQALEKAFTSEVLKKVIDNTIENMKWADLPYRLKERIEKEMKDMELTPRKYKIIAEVVEED